MPSEVDRGNIWSDALHFGHLSTGICSGSTVSIGADNYVCMHKSGFMLVQFIFPHVTPLF